MLKLTLPAPRAKADDLLALTETHPEIALDVGENPADTESYLYTFFLPETSLPALQQALTIHSLKVPAPEPVDETIDYVAQTKANFPPLQIGPFFIARNAEEAPAETIALSIAPNRAFGSGEHATTTGCLLAYLEIEKTRSFNSGLDFGAGSGILAIAAAKQHGIPFVCVDNDEPSVEICAQNAAENGVADLIDSRLGTTPPEAETFDLVFANILLTPLLENAPALKAALAPMGHLILSGFTDDQAEQIEAAYSQLGLKKLWQHTQAHWMAQLWHREG